MSLIPPTRYSTSYFGTWGPYWDVMFPPQQVTRWANYKRGTSGVNVARRYWEQRETLRRAYESIHGSDPRLWPSRHPGVVLDAVPGPAHAGCLGCQWFGPGGDSAPAQARLHESTNGAS